MNRNSKQHDARAVLATYLSLWRRLISTIHKRLLYGRIEWAILWFITKQSVSNCSVRGIFINDYCYQVLMKNISVFWTDATNNQIHGEPNITNRINAMFGAISFTWLKASFSVQKFPQKNLHSLDCRLLPLLTTIKMILGGVCSQSWTAKGKSGQISVSSSRPSKFQGPWY